MTDDFPVHDELDALEGRTIYKSEDWWKAAVLLDGFSGPEIAVYLWKKSEGDWKRQQKYAIRSKSDWKRDREAIESLVINLED